MEPPDFGASWSELEGRNIFRDAEKDAAQLSKGRISAILAYRTDAMTTEAFRDACMYSKYSWALQPGPFR